MQQNGSSPTPPPSIDDSYLNAALEQALAHALAEYQRAGEKAIALINAQAQAVVAQMREQVTNGRSDAARVVAERLALVRDGERGPPGIDGRDGKDGESIIGPAGPIGSRGEMGLPGVPGRDGKDSVVPGPQGAPGLPGVPGESIVGPPGEPGPAGPAGIPGLAGPKGDAGPPGESITGPPGPPGDSIKGDKGDRGEPGASVKGDQGDQGPPGESIKGDKGDRGEPGLSVKGEKGDPGEAIVGPQGPQGPQGAPGARGKLPIVKLWREGSVTYEAEVVAYAGACYQALQDTAQSPGGSDWICLSVAGRDGRSPVVRELYDPKLKYAALDVVALDGASFMARKDEPGPCPGDGWQLSARQGARGIAGPKGDRGPQGPAGADGRPGAPALTIKGWKVDRQHFLAIPIMSDGKEGPALELRALFDQAEG